MEQDCCTMLFSLMNDEDESEDESDDESDDYTVHIRCVSRWE
jgi:hypothetical protein